MKSSIFKLCNETIYPGEKLKLALPLPELFSCAPLYMPIKIAHGKKSGPCLLLIAALHGNELDGTEIIRRLFEEHRLKSLRGTILAIPVLNVYGLINRSRDLPGGVSLDRCFPGSPTGTHASRVAHSFTEEIFAKADICIDLQTGCPNHGSLPKIYLNPSDQTAKDLAMAFNPPVISPVACDKGSLPRLAYEQQKPFLRYEAGEAMRFDERAIRTGLKGILGVMRKLEMLPPTKNIKKEKPIYLDSCTAEKTIWIYASTSGISHTKHKLGQRVKKGEILCTIKDPFGTPNEISVKSPEEAIIVGKNNLPLVYEGESLFQLALFSKIADAADQLGEWQEQTKI